MTVVLLFISLGIVTFLLLYGYWSINFQSKKVSKAHLEIEKLRNTETNLKNEITTLQNKIQLSLKDPVTNLPTKELFADRLDFAVKECERYHLTMGVFCVDLSDFSSINEAFSYEVGNLLLLEVGKRLQSCIRQIDSVARLENDTFAILLPNLTKPEAATIIVQRILQEFTQPFYIHDHEFHIALYIGIAIFPLDAVDAVDLLNNAKHALHLTKENDKTSYQFYQKELQIESQRKYALYNSLNRKPIFQECILYYQPIVDIQNKKIVCLDVLLSYKHPDLGSVNSKEIFEAAKKQNKMNEFLAWLIESIHKEYIDWQAQGFTPGLIALSLPIKQLESHHFIYNLSQILQKVEFEAKNLLLQIKGNFSLLPLDVLEKTFNMLNYMGIKLAIDDFGSAILPLHYLKLNVNYLKLDPSLAASLMNDKQTQALVKSIITLAKNMKMEVIAKGVDTEMQMAEFKALDCFLMQGQLFYPPLEGQEIVKKVQTTTVA